MNIPIGWIIAMACALGGYALHGGHIMVLWQPTEVLTIVGAAVGTMIAANTPTNLKKMFSALGRAFKNAKNVKQKSLDLLCLMFEILQKIKRDGLMSLEGDIEEPESSPLFEKYPEIMKDHHLVDFITDYLRMMLGGSLDVIQIESLMEQELEVHHHEAHIPVNAVTNVGDGLPAFGIVAAVMGVVHTMGSIGLPPAELGKLIGAALVGTFLGILLAYAFVSPVAKVLEQKAEADGRAYMAIKAILIASLNNFPPAAAVEFGRKVLFSYQRPSFAELDEGTKAVKGK
ncbi:flagellar motor stator protein MotA [Polynucleobacter sp. AP-Jannik-300A-C4]|uniref:flagellar motor stator protein MotA n=1 Tax=Polynucleobacter sp. AP-Jannik-300A-C4 TaxID=2576928 RepID=UPI001BFE7B79|nr:flagellar motor stator protein MotA [Polynucleobacter sp. AP-Jannik-300A-C4]QWE23087.1 flagellar motor stator protein MotA [Polynucleobacter sp. AP-Jannik-300A-C4]